MAVDVADVDAITQALVRQYRDAEIYLLRLIAATLAKGIDAPTWAQERLAAVAALRRSAEQVLRELEVDRGETIRQQLAQAYRTGAGSALSDLLPEESAAIGARAATAVVTRTDAIESLASAVARDIGERHSNVLRHVIDVYRHVVTQASSLAVANGLTRRQASQIAFQRFVDRGVVSFTDEGGRTWRLSSYVEMALRTVTQRAAVQGQTDRLQSLGIELVMVSDSPGECPLCRPWEHKVLTIAGEPGEHTRTLPSVVTGEPVEVEVAGSLTEARAAGLFHPNCTHAARAFLPGATKIPDRQTADPEHHAAKERQREIERAIRRWKERDASAMTDEARAAARAKVRYWQGVMREHLADNPRLKRLRYREQIGAGNIPRPGQIA